MRVAAVEKIPFKNITPLIVIFLAAFLFRILYWIFLKNNYSFYEHPGGDVLYYQQWAKDIARGNWLGSATFWGLPLYPYFLAVLERLSLGNLFLVRLAHIFLGSLNCVLAYVVARKLFSKEVAFLSGFLMAASFSLIHYDWLMMPVPLLVFLSLTIVLSFLNTDKIKTRHEWGMLGLLIGITALGDGKLLIFVALTLLYSFLKDQRLVLARMSKTFLPMMIGIIFILGIAGMRNKVVGGDWVWISAQNGLSFYVGNNPKATGVFENPDFIRPTHGGQDADQVIAAEVIAKRKLTPAQVGRFWRNQAFTFIKNNPLDYLRLLGRKFRLFFTETEYAYDLDMVLQRDWKRRVDINPFGVICPLALVGMVMARARGRETAHVNIMILSQLMFTLVFFLTDRHRVIILPFLIIYESYALFGLAGQVHLRRLKPVAAAVGLILVFMAFLGPQAMPARDVAFYRLIKSAAVFERKKDFARAQEQYSLALALRPDDTNAMYNLANIHAMTGRWASARDYYEKVLSLNPYHIDALHNLGFVQEKEGADRQSFATFRRLLQLEPDAPDVLFQLGQIAQRTGDCASAQTYFEHLIQLKPNFARELRLMMDSCHP